MALIEIKSLTKTYEEKGGVKTQALRGINLDIERGYFAAIAGSSGSGKSTLLNLIGALDTPTSGQIRFADQNITEIPLNQLAEFRLKSIGFVFQAYNLVNTLTARENVEYIMLLQGVDSKTRLEKADALLERVGLKDHLNRRPYQMSGGQQQRVAVARALAAEPQVILADEPTANLDSKTSENLLCLMKELNQEKNMTFIFSTHDQMVMNQAECIYKIKDGLIL